MAWYAAETIYRLTQSVTVCWECDTIRRRLLGVCAALTS